MTVQKIEYAHGHSDHSARMPAVLTTLRHFSVSSTISLPKACGESGSGVSPNSAMR
jgi:hypothetical protein